MEFNVNKGIKKYEKNKCACGEQALFYMKLDGNNSVFHLCKECAKNIADNIMNFYEKPSELVEGKTYSRNNYKKHMSSWTDEDIEILTSGLKIEELVKKLGKTKSAIRMKANRIGYKIPFEREYYFQKVAREKNEKR